MSFGIYSVFLSKVKGKKEDKQTIKKESQTENGLCDEVIKQTIKKEVQSDEILCDEIVAAVKFLELKKSEKNDNISKEKCKIVPIMFNEDYTKYKDLLTDKVYPVVLNGTIVNRYDEDFVELKEIDGERRQVIKYTNEVLYRDGVKCTEKFNKIDDIKNYCGWQFSLSYIDYSEIKNDYDFACCETNLLRDAFQVQWDATKILEQKHKIIPETLNYNHRSYSLKDLKKIAQLGEKTFNEKFEENYEERVKEAKIYQEAKNKKNEQNKTFRSF